MTQLDNRSITLEVRSQHSTLVTALNTDDRSAPCRIPPGLVPVAGHASGRASGDGVATARMGYLVEHVMTEARLFP